MIRFVCNIVQPTVSETEFSYRTALGIRFDISDKTFIRASVGEYYIDFDNSSSDSSNTVTQFEFGFNID